jgi:hypothetical protein
MKEQKEISPILFWQELAISSSSSVLICWQVVRGIGNSVEVWGNSGCWLY